MVTPTEIIQKPHSQMEGKKKVPDHKIRTGHGSKVKTDSCWLTCTGYHNVTSLYQNFHDWTSAIFLLTTRDNVMHSSLPAAEKEQVSDGLDLGYQLMRLAVG